MVTTLVPSTVMGMFQGGSFQVSAGPLIAQLTMESVYINVLTAYRKPYVTTIGRPKQTDCKDRNRIIQVATKHGPVTGLAFLLYISEKCLAVDSVNRGGSLNSKWNFLLPAHFSFSYAHN